MGMGMLRLCVFLFIYTFSYVLGRFLLCLGSGIDVHSYVILVFLSSVYSASVNILSVDYETVIHRL